MLKSLKDGIKEGVWVDNLRIAQKKTHEVIFPTKKRRCCR